jgi:hypothetical protein
MANLRDPIGHYVYTWDDNITQSSMRLTSSIAVAGGFTAADPNGSYRPWTGDGSDMRHIGLRIDGDTRVSDRIPVADPHDPRLNVGGTVNGVAGRDGWRITGSSGERRTFA